MVLNGISNPIKRHMHLLEFAFERLLNQRFRPVFKQVLIIQIVNLVEQIQVLYNLENLLIIKVCVVNATFSNSNYLN